MGVQEIVGKYQGYFIVDYSGNEVIYSDGYENENGLWCYKLSDLYKAPPKEEVLPQNEEQVNEEGGTQGEAQEDTPENAQEDAQGEAQEKEEGNAQSNEGTSEQSSEESGAQQNGENNTQPSEESGT